MGCPLPCGLSRGQALTGPSSVRAIMTGLSARPEFPSVVTSNCALRDASYGQISNFHSELALALLNRDDRTAGRDRLAFASNSGPYSALSSIVELRRSLRGLVSPAVVPNAEPPTTVIRFDQPYATGARSYANFIPTPLTTAAQDMPLRVYGILFTVSPPPVSASETVTIGGEATTGPIDNGSLGIIRLSVSWVNFHGQSMENVVWLDLFTQDVNLKSSALILPGQPHALSGGRVFGPAKLGGTGRVFVGAGATLRIAATYFGAQTEPSYAQPVISCLAELIVRADLEQPCEDTASYNALTLPACPDPSGELPASTEGRGAGAGVIGGGGANPGRPVGGELASGRTVIRDCSRCGHHRG